MDGQQSNTPAPTTFFRSPVPPHTPVSARYRPMSSQQPFTLASSVCTGALADPFDDEWNYLMDTRNWTAEDWGAARFLAELLRLRNAGKGLNTSRAHNNQGSIRGMCKVSPLCPRPSPTVEFLDAPLSGGIAEKSVGVIIQGAPNNQMVYIHPSLRRDGTTGYGFPAIAAGNKNGHKA